MKKQDWSPRDSGVPLRKVLETSVSDAWWGALRDYRYCLGASRLQDFLVQLCHRRAFRILAVRQIKRKMAVPSSRRLDTAGDVAHQVFLMVEKTTLRER